MSRLTATEIASILHGPNLPTFFRKDLSFAELPAQEYKNISFCQSNIFRANFAEGAVFVNCNFTQANMFKVHAEGVKFVNCSFSRADMEHAKMKGSTFEDCWFSYARLHYLRAEEAEFWSCNFEYSSLFGARFWDARMDDTKLPDPGSVLQANWGRLSDELNLAAMRLDASAHPDPKAFLEWAEGGQCPYANVDVQRQVKFYEDRDLYEPGPAPRIYALMAAIMHEKLARWDGPKGLDLYA